MKYTNQKMYNGRMITNTINKPLLHKKGKQWIVVGLSALMLAGFGGAIGLGQSTVHADTNTVQTSINKNLAQNNKQSSSASSNNTQSSTNASNSNKATSTSTSEVTDQAKNLHANLLANATLAPVTGTNDSANNGQKNNQANANKHEEVVSEPEVGNASGQYLGMNYTSDGNGAITFTGSLTGQSSDFWGDGSYSYKDTPVTRARKLVFGTNDNPVDFTNVPYGSLEHMFRDSGNSNVHEIDFNNVTGMNHITNMNHMFGSDNNNSNLHAINLGKGFDMSSVNSDTDMFGTGQPVDTNHNITVSSLTTYGNLKPDVMSQVNIPNMQTGNYDGLNYIYDSNTSTVMFTNGTLIWNNGIGKWGNDGSQQFIGNNDENPREPAGQNAPSIMNEVKHIVFRNVDASQTLNEGGGNNSNGSFFISSAPNVQSIDLGSDFNASEINGDAGDQLSYMFSGDSNLQEIDVPYLFVNSWVYANNMFTGDNKLSKIKIYPKASNVNVPGNYPTDTQFTDSDGLSNNWSYFINKPLTPGTYIRENLNVSDFVKRDYSNNLSYPSNLPNNLRFADFAHRSDMKDVGIPDFEHDSFQEGGAKVTYNTSNDTITFSNGTLSDNPNKTGTSSAAIPTKIKDTTTGKWVPSDLLPNRNNDWTIRFDNVTAPESIYFDLDGKNENYSQFETNSSTSKETRNALEIASRNFIGNQVSNIDLSGLKTNVKPTTNMEGLMINDYNLKHVNFGDGSKFDTSKVTNMDMMLGSDGNLNYLDLSSLKGNNLTEAWDMLCNDKNLQGVKLSAQFSPQLNNDNPNNSVNLGEMFSSDPSLRFSDIDWNGFNTKHVKYFYGMFRSDTALGSVKLPSSFDTSSASDFGHNRSLGSMEHGNNNDVDGMFQSDNGTTSIDLGPSFNTSRASDMAGMFRADKALKTINLGNNFNTSNVNDMQQMFGFSDPISDLNLPAGFDTRKAYHTNSDSSNNGQARMFESDRSLNKITINSPYTIFNDKDNKDITSDNNHNNKYSYNAWGYISDLNGYLHYNPEPKLYRENGKKDASGKPTTLADSHDFSNGKDGINNGAIMGTFTVKNTNPGVQPLHPTDYDTIDYVDVDNTVVGTQLATGGDTLPIPSDDYNNSDYIPSGYKLDTSHHYNFHFDNGDHLVYVINKGNANLPVTPNEVEVQGDVVLHFTNKEGETTDYSLPYGFQTNPDESSDSNNVLEHVDNNSYRVPNPSGYASSNDVFDMDNGFSLNANSYSYNSAASNDPYEFTISSNQAQRSNGSQPIINRNVNLYYSAANSDASQANDYISSLNSRFSNDESSLSTDYNYISSASSSINNIINESSAISSAISQATSNSNWIKSINWSSASAQISNDASNISKDETSISNNSSNITNNTSNINKLNTSLNTDINSVSTAVSNASKVASADSSNLNSSIGSLSSSASTQASDAFISLGNISTSVGGLNTDVNGLKTRMSTAETNITNYKNELSTDETNISNNSKAISNDTTSLANNISNASGIASYAKSLADSLANVKHPVNKNEVGTLILRLIYRNRTNGQATMRTVYRTIMGTPSDNHQISIYPEAYDKTGYKPESMNPFTVSVSQLTNGDWANNIISHEFYYDAQPIDLKIQYKDTNDPSKTFSSDDDLGTVGLDGQTVDLKVIQSKNNSTNSDVISINGMIYKLQVPEGYHLTNADNPEILHQTSGEQTTMANPSLNEVADEPVMLLTVPMTLSTKPSSSANSNNNKPAKPASSSASSSNNVPPAPNSNSNGGGSVSPSSNGGGFIPNGGGYVPIPIPYPTPTPTPASNSNNTPHNSTTILPGSTTNNYYSNDNNTTNNYYSNRSDNTSHYVNHSVRKIKSLKDLKKLGVNKSGYYRGAKITRLNVPARFRWIYITKTCLAHNDLSSIGKVRNYGYVLRPNHRITLRIGKLFKIQQGKITNYKYEVQIGRHNYFVTSNYRFTRNAYYQPTDLRRTRSHGVFRHRYYRARLINVAGVYTRPSYSRRNRRYYLRRGQTVRIRRVISIGRKGDFQTRFQLTNGDYITANKNWIKLI